jgi:hypothetical protein
VSQKDSLSIKVLTVDKLPELASFLEAEGAAGLSRDTWLLKFKVFWDENPFFKDDPRGWIIENKENKIVGFLGNIPVVYQAFGQEEKAYWATTWFVSESGRSKSLDLFRCFMKQKGILFDTTPSKAVERILSKRFKFSKKIFVWTQSEYVIPVNFRSFARFASSKSDKLGPLFYAMGCLFCLCLRGSNFLLSKVSYLSRRKMNAKVSLISSMPDDIESWWQLCGKSDALMLKRNRKTLNWLFFSSLRNSRKIFEIREGGCLIGLAAFKVCNRQSWSYLELLDFLLIDGIPQQKVSQIITSLVSLVFGFDESVAYIRFYPIFRESHSLLLRLGFIKVEGKSKFYYLDKRNSGPCISNVLGAPIDGDRALF